MFNKTVSIISANIFYLKSTGALVLVYALFTNGLLFSHDNPKPLQIPEGSTPLFGSTQSVAASLFSDKKAFFTEAASPLEQFEVISFLGLNAPVLGAGSGFNLTLTNLGFYTILTLSIALLLHILGDGQKKLIPSK